VVFDPFLGINMACTAGAQGAADLNGLPSYWWTTPLLTRY